MGNITMQGPVNGYLPKPILARVKELAPTHWNPRDLIIGQICVIYDYTHQTWMDPADANSAETFDLDEHIRTFLAWADHMVKENPAACHKLRAMWRKAKTYEARNESCSQGGEISDYLYDKFDDFFL